MMQGTRNKAMGVAEAEEEEEMELGITRWWE